MKFLDSSAIIPLLVQEPTTAFCVSYAQRAGDDLIVWWGSTLECISAICRLERQQTLTPAQVTASLARLRHLHEAWSEVVPSSGVRQDAERLLRVHPLRAADALQLAAALAVCGKARFDLEFLTFDERLRTAADKEGLQTIREKP